MVNST